MNSPAIRFAGFTDDWEQRKLGGLGRVSTGNTPPTSENDNWSDSADGHVWITPTDINACLMSNSVRHLTDIGWAIARVVPAFSVLITSIASIGKNAVNTIPVAFNQQINAIIPEGNDAYFILSAMEKCKERFAGTAGQTATAIINKTEFEKFSLSIPSVQEQQQVGGFFFSLDRLITLHQREHDKTVNIKKALLEKMFPKDGEDKPEIRFAGFTDAWEQWKLGDIADQTYGGGTPPTSNRQFWTGDIPWIQSSDLAEDRLFGVVPRKYISSNAIAASATRIIPKDSIAIITRVGVGKLAFMPFSYASSQDFLSLSGLKLDGVFTAYALHKKLQSKRHVVQGTSIKGITKEELLINTIMVPHYADEQRQVGSFFTNIDRLITLHQRELTKLQNIKKALLEKMFV